jgi:hypothetical protein
MEHSPKSVPVPERAYIDVMTRRWMEGPNPPTYEEVNRRRAEVDLPPLAKLPPGAGSYQVTVTVPIRFDVRADSVGEAQTKVEQVLRGLFEAASKKVPLTLLDIPAPNYSIRPKRSDSGRRG